GRANREGAHRRAIAPCATLARCVATGERHARLLATESAPPPHAHAQRFPGGPQAGGSTHGEIFPPAAADSRRAAGTVRGTDPGSGTVPGSITRLLVEVADRAVRSVMVWKRP